MREKKHLEKSNAKVKVLIYITYLAIFINILQNTIKPFNNYDYWDLITKIW